jgi:hypothetical protein
MRDWLYPYFCGAGHGARARYLDGSKSWRIRVFRHPWWIRVALLFFVLAVAVAVGHSVWIFLVGLAFGGVSGALFALLDSPPAHIENWRTGWEGERRTAGALAPLRRSGCVLFHDLPDRDRTGRINKANIDHVVVSPGGVFLLDTKWLGGEVSIIGSNVRVTRRGFEDDSYNSCLERPVKASSARLQEDIASLTGISFVHPVIVFWSDFEAGIVERGGVTYVHGSRVAGWLLARNRRLTPVQVADVAACIVSQRPPGAGPWWTRAHKLLSAHKRPGTARAPASSA